jgi:hypothetical protein
MGLVSEDKETKEEKKTIQENKTSPSTHLGDIVFSILEAKVSAIVGLCRGLCGALFLERIFGPRKKERRIFD